MKKDEMTELKENIMTLHLYCHNISVMAGEQLRNVSNHDEVCLSELRKELRKALIELDFIIEIQEIDEE